jgi:hypothetical protein
MRFPATWLRQDRCCPPIMSLFAKKRDHCLSDMSGTLTFWSGWQLQRYQQPWRQVSRPCTRILCCRKSRFLPASPAKTWVSSNFFAYFLQFARAPMQPVWSGLQPPRRDQPLGRLARPCLRILCCRKSRFPPPPPAKTRLVAHFLQFVQHGKTRLGTACNQCGADCSRRAETNPWGDLQGHV